MMRTAAKAQSPILRLLMLTSLITGFISCQKEVPPAPKPAIKLSAAKDTAYVGERIPISVQLEGIDHRFQIVERDSKNSTVSDKDGKKTADWKADRNQKAMFYFTAMEEGMHELRFRAVDQGNQSATATLELTVKRHSFKVEADSEQKEVLTQESVDVTLHIEDTVGARFPKRLRCQSDLKGAFTIEGKPCTAGVPVSIGTEKDIAIRFKALQSGQGKLHFTVSDTNKIIQTVSTPLTVTDPTFTVALTAEQDTVYVNKTTGLQLKITDEQNTRKTLRCYSDLGGSFTVEGQACTANSTIDIGTKTKIDDIVFKPAKIGTAHLKFILQDAYQKQERQAAVHAKGVPFKVRLIADPDQGNLLANKGLIHVKITTDSVDASGITYQLSGNPISGTGKGTISTHPTGIKANSSLDLTYTLNRETDMEPSGKHTISVSVRDNYGQTLSDTTSFDVVVLPKITYAHLYYTHHSGSNWRKISLKSIAGTKGSFPIDSLSITLINCSGSTKVTRSFDYNPSTDSLKTFVVLHTKSELGTYNTKYGCSQIIAEGIIQLIDVEGNRSSPLIVPLY